MWLWTAFSFSVSGMFLDPWPQFLAGCRGKAALSPCHMAVFIGSVQNMAAYFFTASKTEVLSKAGVAILCNIIMQLTFHRLCHILLGRSKSQVPHTLKAKGSQKRGSTAADPSLCAVANVAISLRYNVSTTLQALF